jgi:hypothetical protein
MQYSTQSIMEFCRFILFYDQCGNNLLKVQSDVLLFQCIICNVKGVETLCYLHVHHSVIIAS